VNEELMSEVLDAGMDGWVPLSQDLVEQGLVLLGQVTDGGFFATSEPLSKALNSIEVEMTSTSEEMWAWSWWVENTAAGNERAHGVPVPEYPSGRGAGRASRGRPKSTCTASLVGKLPKAARQR